MKLNHKGFALLELTLIVVVTLLLGVGGYYIYSQNFASTLDNQSCNTQDGVEYCVTPNKTEISGVEDLEITSIITNKSDSPLRKTFPCTDNDPTVFINGEKDTYNGICLTAISEVVIEPGKSEKYTTSISGSKLSSGINEVYLSWTDYQSGLMQINRLVDADAEQLVRNKCLAGEYHSSCVSVIGFLYEENIDEPCSKFEYLYSDLNIQPADWYCDDGTVGLGFIPFYVPRDEAEEWRSIFAEKNEFEFVDVE